MRDLANGAGHVRVFKATMAATFADPFLFVGWHRRYHCCAFHRDHFRAFPYGQNIHAARL